MANPFMQPQQPMQITIEAPKAVLDIMELRMEEVALTLTRMVSSNALTLIVDAPMVETVREVAAQVDAQATVQFAPLAQIDWVTQVQKDFPAFRLGRFYVYASHARDTVSHNAYPLLVDAVAAFGTGEHDTTAGCLLALADIRKKRARVGEVLDVGCGTAILAIGAARLWKAARVSASDNDPVAVRVSRHNLRVNRVAARAKAWVGDGYRKQPLVRLAPHALVVANILARPLMNMARDAARKLAPGGVLILSGLLHSQENMVLAAHRVQGLRLMRRIRRGKWSVLVLKAGH